MPNVVSGNTKGLAPSEIRAVAKLFQRSVSPDEIVSLDLAREMCFIGEQLRRLLRQWHQFTHDYSSGWGARTCTRINGTATSSSMAVGR
jgi:hypothetical protein